MGLAVLTRATGIVLFLPLLLEYLVRYWRIPRPLSQRLFALLALALPLLALAGYLFYLQLVWKDPLIFLFAERAGWGRHSALPWQGLLDAVLALFNGYQLRYNLLDLLFTLLPLLILVLGWRRLPISYSLYSLGLVLFSLSNPSITTEPLTSVPRYLLVVFPCFLLLALWGERPALRYGYYGLATALLIVFTVCFVHHYWLA